MSTRIEQIAKWAEGLSFDRIPGGSVERAKYQLLNIIAAAHAGQISPAARKLLEAARDWDVGGDAPVVSTGEMMSLQGALFVNTALSMAHDYDDYLFFGHTGHSAVFASLLMGLAEKKSVKDILAGIVLGNEIGGRIGAACLIGPQNGQMWTTIHVAETAAIAAKMMGLDAGKIANAIAIGFYQPPFALAPGFMGPDTKILSAAQTARAGLMAAMLAGKGFTGPLDIFENPRGFLAQFSYAPLEFMLTGWGKSWVTESLAYKTVPGCAYIDTCVDATMMALDKFRKRVGRDMTPGDVREIEVRASLLTIGMNRLSEDHLGRGILNPIAINFSIPANVAIIVMTGSLEADNLDPDWLDLHHEDILSFCRRVNLKHDWEMSLAVSESVNEVLDLGGVIDYVGMSKLLNARKKAAAHFGTGVSLGLKDFLEMRKQAGAKGKAYFDKLASGAWKRILGGKSSRSSGGEPDLGDCDFSRFRMPFAAEVIIKTTDWKEYSARQDIPFGSPGHPWEDTAARVEKKFRREAGRHLSEGQVAWVLDNLAGLEKTSATELMENLTAVEGGKGSSAKPKPATRKADKKPEQEKKAEPVKTKPETGGKKPDYKSKKKDDILPPVSFEPVGQKKKSSGAPGRRQETKAPKAETGTEPTPKKETPKTAVKSKSTDEKTDKKVGETLRPAGYRERSKRPPKGAKRKRMNRP